MNESGFFPVQLNLSERRLSIPSILHTGILIQKRSRRSLGSLLSNILLLDFRGITVFSFEILIWSKTLPSFLFSSKITRMHNY